MPSAAVIARANRIKELLEGRPLAPPAAAFSAYPEAPIPQTGWYIEHKNGDTTDNRVENLGWCRFGHWLERPARKVDWVLVEGLTAGDIEFVRGHLKAFRRLYGIAPRRCDDGP